MTVSRGTNSELSAIATDVVNTNLVALLRFHRAVRRDVSFVNAELRNICARGGDEGSESENGQPFENQHCFLVELSIDATSLDLRAC